MALDQAGDAGSDGKCGSDVSERVAHRQREGTTQGRRTQALVQLVAAGGQARLAGCERLSVPVPRQRVQHRHRMRPACAARNGHKEHGIMNMKHLRSVGGNSLMRPRSGSHRHRVQPPCSIAKCVELSNTKQWKSVCSSAAGSEDAGVTACGQPAAH